MHASNPHPINKSSRQYSRRFVSIRPWQLWAAIAVLVFVGIGALPSGYNFIADPSGAAVGIPEGTLNSPLFPDYLIPGLFLFFVVGCGSLLSALALLLRPQWSALQKLNPIKHQEWSWTFAVTMGLIIMLWIVVQVFSISLNSYLQPIVFLLGATIVGCMLTRKVRDFLLSD